jgi:hypothetical protein
MGTAHQPTFGQRHRWAPANVGPPPPRHRATATVPPPPPPCHRHRVIAAVGPQPSRHGHRAIATVGPQPLLGHGRREHAHLLATATAPQPPHTGYRWATATALRTSRHHHRCAHSHRAHSHLAPLSTPATARTGHRTHGQRAHGLSLIYLPFPATFTLPTSNLLDPAVGSGQTPGFPFELFFSSYHSYPITEDSCLSPPTYNQIHPLTITYAH